MAVRIEFFTVAGSGDFELVTPAALTAAVAAFDARTGPETDVVPHEGAGVRCVGWLSASDHDEERFTAWCDEIDDVLGIGLLHQGVDDAMGVAQLPAGRAPRTHADAWQAAWSGTLRGALTAAAAAGGRLGWRTNFDLAGTAGTPDDYPTAARPAG